MRVLVVGNGAREYAIGLALKNDKKVKDIYFAPGNGATSNIGLNLPFTDFITLTKFAKENNIDLTIVGSEAPLVDGIVDVFEKEGLKIFGPSKKAAQLEGSKIFMKEFLAKNNILTAKFIQTNDEKKANDFIENLNVPIVIKADGLCAGKGVIIAKDKKEAKQAAKEMLRGKSFGDAGKNIIIEEFLDGYELSIFAICDGEDFIILPAAQDHKRLLDGDKGVNTGGMGAYAPTPLANENIYEKVKQKILKPTLDGMKKESNPFKGVLFIGAMIVDGEPYVLEYNVRFGDPECEVLMPLIKSSVFDMFYASTNASLKSLKLEFFNKYAVGVVMASKNYPYKNSKPSEIIVDGELENAHIAYGGVEKIEDNLFATGGRVLVCVGIADDLNKARNKAYELCSCVHFAGKQYRNDISYQALK